jgi:hypothetical protein
VLTLRSCTYRGRKLLFDSDHVNDDGEYAQQQQHDGKFIKDTVSEFAFGSVSINSSSNNGKMLRFTKLNHDNKTHLVWAAVSALDGGCQGNNNDCGELNTL